MFLDTALFEFVGALESRWEAIRDEYLALPTDRFDPWVQREMHGGGWTVFGLFALGQKIPGACAVCPKTADALDTVPGLTLAGFSRLAPGAHIHPHVGYSSNVYRVHLGLVVPDACYMRVGKETRAWQEGKCLVFDDTQEHETWNHSPRPRGVLLLDFLRPGVASTDSDSVPENIKQYAASLLGAEPGAAPDGGPG